MDDKLTDQSDLLTVEQLQRIACAKAAGAILRNTAGVSTPFTRNSVQTGDITDLADWIYNGWEEDEPERSGFFSRLFRGFAKPPAPDPWLEREAGDLAQTIARGARSAREAAADSPTLNEIYQHNVAFAETESDDFETINTEIVHPYTMADARVGLMTKTYRIDEVVDRDDDSGLVDLKIRYRGTGEFRTLSPYDDEPLELVCAACTEKARVEEAR
jgi:hypothetical protein